jgi:hypothetical protein
MKYVFITCNGLALPIAYKLQQEGHEVVVGQIEDVKDYVMEEEIDHAEETEFAKTRRLDLFKGMLDIRPANPVIEMLLKVDPKGYFVFFEENNLYRWADKIRHLPFEGNFPTKEDYLFEIDRDFAKNFVRKYYPRLYTPEVREFSTIEQAITFLRKTKEIWVLKGKDDSAPTFVPDVDVPELANAQVIDMLENFPTKYMKLGFILELFIPFAIELTPEIMFYDGVPLFSTLGIENKSFGSGNLSIQTGCSEDLVFPTYLEDRINKISFPPIVFEMALKHKGLFIWDASLLINKRDGKIFFGEFCSNRPGYNSFFTELSQAKSVNEFFAASVEKVPALKPGTVGTSVRIFNMNRDTDTEQLSENMKVDYKPEIEKDLWLWDVKRNNGEKILTVGSDWNLAIITGAGKSINEAINKLYKNVDGFSFVGSYYRSEHDFISLDYPTSILSRLNYGLERGLYRLPFEVRIGEI